MATPVTKPPWLELLNAMHVEWREWEIESGRNPDPYIERVLRENDKWPVAQKRAE